MGNSQNVFSEKKKYKTCVLVLPFVQERRHEN